MERITAKNKNLNEAKKNKNDEFYTRLTDIEKEVHRYKDQLKDKVVYLNCDEPEWSNFFRFFASNFAFFELRKLIATHYRDDAPSYKLELTQALTQKTYGTFEEDKEQFKTPLAQNGDFRSPECVELLKEADVVVTNPPFSLFREYIAQLIEYDKKFLVIGNQNAITYKEIFPLIKDNRVWLGVSTNGSNRWFRVPKDYPIQEKASNYKYDDEGNLYLFVNGIQWFTNLQHTKRNEKLILFRNYTPEVYPKYDNYDAINVNKVVDIPMDYDGVMGVPITFLDKFNPEQFEILGMTKTPICFDNQEGAKRTKTYTGVIQNNLNGTKTSGNKINDGAAILSKRPNGEGVYYTTETEDGYLSAVYARILIIRKVNENANNTQTN